MSTSYQNSSDCFKSPRRVQVWFLKSSRDLNRNKSRQYKRERDEAQKQLKRIQNEQDRIRQATEQLKDQLQDLLEQKEQTEQTAAKPGIEFEDPPVGSHGYGARMIDLAIKLVKEGIALRAVSRVLDVVFEVLGIDGKTPSYWTVRNWVQRLGHATLTQETAKADDWVWLMDHSVQIGQEKTLLVLAVRQADLPPAGEALKHEDVCPIALTPRTSWSGEDVCQELEKLSQEHSVPRAIVTDHGADLVRGIQQFQQNHPQVIELYDFKHKAACCLKALLKTNERFAAFQTKVSATRNAIQQTELAFLTPPRPKTKARFMNLGPTLAWAEKMLRLLDHPAPKARQWVSEQRFEGKLGWLRKFRDSVAEWSECQRVVNLGVKFANEHGLESRGGRPTACRDAFRLGSSIQPKLGQETHRLRRRRASQAQGKRASAAEHRNRRIEFRQVQTIGASTRARRVYRPTAWIGNTAWQLWRRDHSQTIRTQQGQRRAGMDQQTTRHHLCIQASHHLPRL